MSQIQKRRNPTKKKKIVSTIPVRYCNIHTLSLLAHSLRDDLVTEVKTVSWLVVSCSGECKELSSFVLWGEKGVGTANQDTLWEWETRHATFPTFGFSFPIRRNLGDTLVTHDTLSFRGNTSKCTGYRSTGYS